MKKSRILGPVLLALVVISLAWHSKKKVVEDPFIGSADASGDLVLHVFSPGAKDPNVALLTTAYGVVLYHSRERGAMFVLGDRARNAVREFSYYPDFVKALGELPSDSVLTIYDRCTVPPFFDFYPLEEEMYEKLKRDCTRRRLKLGDMPKITCTCSSMFL